MVVDRQRVDMLTKQEPAYAPGLRTFSSFPGWFRCSKLLKILHENKQLP